MMPCRERCIDVRKASTDDTVWNASIVSRQGNRDVSNPGKWRGPGVGSPNMLQTLFKIVSQVGRLIGSQGQGTAKSYPTTLTEGFLDLRCKPAPVIHPINASARGHVLDRVGHSVAYHLSRQSHKGHSLEATVCKSVRRSTARGTSSSRNAISPDHSSRQFRDSHVHCRIDLGNKPQDLSPRAASDDS